MQKKISDMTEGNITKLLIIFALPLLGSSLIQQLYNTADMIFVGNFINKQAAAAVGASGLLFTCLIGLLTGLSVGLGILISQKIGAKDIEVANRTAHTAILFGFISGIILTFIGLIFAENLLNIMNTPKEIMKESTIYLKIYFLSMIPMIFYNLGSAIIRSSGNSKIPFYILTIGGVLNIIANAIFIVFLKMGVAGVAIATFISQSITAILVMKYLFSKKFIIKLELAYFKIDFSLLRNILYYGLPAGVQSMVITFSNIVVQYYINGYGEDAVAAYATYFKLENFIWMPIVAVGQAITTFTGQNVGAQKYERVKSGTLIAVIIASLIAILIAGVILSLPNLFFRIFIKDLEVVVLGIKIIFITFPFYWLYSILETVGGSIRGMGHSLTSMIVTMTSLCGLRIILLLGISKINLGFQGVALVYPLTWFVTALVFSTLFYKFTNKKC